MPIFPRTSCLKRVRAKATTIDAPVFPEGKAGAGQEAFAVKLMRWIILPPLALLAMALAVANRHNVTFSLDPFDPVRPALGIDMPLALIVLIALFLGILIGGAAAWGHARHKAARRGQPLMPEPGSGGTANLPARQD